MDTGSGIHLNATYGAVAVGYFSIAQQMAEKIQLPVQAVQDVVYQKMSVLPGHMGHACDESLSSINLVGNDCRGSLLAPWVVVPLLGPAYANVVGPTQILLAGVAFTGVSQLLDVYFVNQLHRPGLASILASGKHSSQMQ